jgi:RecJ-like exonuclease
VNDSKTNIVPRVVIVYSDQMIVIRANPGNLSFDVNELVLRLRELIPQGKIAGGGHDVAGSIRFIPGVKDLVLRSLEKLISSLL